MNRELEKLRQDPNNWRYAGLVYHCGADPRLIVPMRVRGTGYAMNFAHSPAIPVLAAILLALLTPLALPFVFGFPAPPALSCCSWSFSGILAALCHWEATRSR